MTLGGLDAATVASANIPSKCRSVGAFPSTDSV